LFYFIKALEDKGGLIMATLIKTKGMAPVVLKVHINQLEALTGAKFKSF